MTTLLDFFTPRTDQIEVGQVLEALDWELFRLWRADVQVDPGEFEAAPETLRTFMLAPLTSFRAASQPAPATGPLL